MSEKDKGQGTPSKGDEEKTYTETEHKGVINDLADERAKRHDSELKFSQSQAQMDSLKRENEKLKKEAEEKESKKSVIEGEDGDILTKKDGRDIEKKAMDSIKKAQAIVKERTDNEGYQRNYNKSESAARTKYSKRKKIGLDYETVKQSALLRLQGRKHRQLDIFQSDNPAEELYEEGLKDPEIKEKLELAENEKILDTMGDRKVDKKGLTGETKNLGFHFYTADEVAAMSLDEASKHKDDIEKSSLKWK